MADFICPMCENSYHEITDKFNKNHALSGDMFILKKEYIDNVWEHFEELPDTLGDNIVCPGCGGCYADSFTGKVREIA